MSKHTKGPWVVDDNEGFGALKIWSGCAPSGNSTIPGQIISVIDETARECEENARLISAAPDLLEALDLITSLASQEWQEPDGSRKGATDNQGRRMWFISADVMQEARAAILKATGEQA